MKPLPFDLNSITTSVSMNERWRIEAGRQGSGYGWDFYVDPDMEPYEVDYLEQDNSAYCTADTFDWLTRNSGRHSVVERSLEARREARQVPESRMRVSYANLAPPIRSGSRDAVELLAGEITGLISTIASSAPTDVQTQVIVKRYGRLRAELDYMQQAVVAIESMLVVLDDVIQKKLEEGVAG